MSANTTYMRAPSDIEGWSVLIPGIDVQFNGLEPSLEKEFVACIDFYDSLSFTVGF